MSGIPFNKNKPYGEVTPPYFGAVFEQVGVDGVSRLYKGTHERVIPPGEGDIEEILAAEDADLGGSPNSPDPAPSVEKPKVARKVKPRAKAKTSTATGRRAKMKAVTVEDNEIRSDSLDLAGWAKQQVEAPFSDVKAAVAAELDVEVDDEVGAAVAIVNAGLLKANEVNVV